MLTFSPSVQTILSLPLTDPQANLERIAEFPITITPGGVEPAATRLNDDNYHLGGTRIHSFPAGPSCTSGFAVQKSGEGDGVMFAAHCGGVGQFWVTVAGLTAWNYGTTHSRQTAYDGAIMKSNFSQGYVWYGPIQSSSVGRIGGVIVPTMGTELCYSGTVCGNVVTARNVQMNLGGDLNSVTAVQTDQRAGTPAAGNGDSGGPGYALATDAAGQTTRYAATIVSAIPGSSPATCTGEPGSTDQGGRKCNSRVYSTEV